MSAHLTASRIVADQRVQEMQNKYSHVRRATRAPCFGRGPLLRRLIFFFFCELPRLLPVSADCYHVASREGKPRPEADQWKR